MTAQELINILMQVDPEYKIKFNFNGDKLEVVNENYSITIYDEVFLNLKKVKE